MWISRPTPVTTSVIVAASGSHNSSADAPRPGIQSNRCSAVIASSDACSDMKKSRAATAAKANDEPIAAMARYPERGSPNLRPMKWFTTAPASGSAMMSQR